LSRPPARLLLSVLCVSLAVLAYEVGLSRAFSVLLRYHYVFLVVSLATCGLGLGGLVGFVLLGARLRSQPLPVLAWAAVALSLLLPASVLALFASPLSARLSSWAVVALVSLPPYLAAGVYLSGVFAGFASEGGRLYWADLTGAALGSLLVILALQELGGINTPLACGGLAAVAALLTGWRSSRSACAAAGAALVLALGLLAWNVTTKRVDLWGAPRRIGPQGQVSPLYKGLFEELAAGRARIVRSEWDAFARTDVERDEEPSARTPYPSYFIYTDGDVPSRMRHFTGDLTEVVPEVEQFLGFFPFRTQRPKRVLLLGPGGGLDILLALCVGAQQVDGVELNAAIPRLMRDPQFADFNGHLYDTANVRIVVDEGRSFVRRSGGSWDLVYLALTKASTTSAEGGMGVAESYVETREAFGDYLDHLRLDGQVAFVCQAVPVALRSLLAAVGALEARGVARAEAVRCVALLHAPLRDPPPGMPDVSGWAHLHSGPYRNLLLVRRQPFSAAEAQRLGEEALALDLTPGYLPPAYAPDPFGYLLQQAPDDTGFAEYVARRYPLQAQINILPCTDDKPFATDLTLGVPPALRNLLVGVGLATLTACALMIGAARHGSKTHLGSGALVLKSTYFATLGVAFMVVEVCLVQKLVLFLGYPTLSLAVVLFSLLLGGGLGSWTSQRWPPRRAAGWCILAAVAIAVVGTAAGWLLGPVLRSALGWPALGRSLLVMAGLLPLGFALGMPFPTGVRLLGAAEANLVPWLWGLNGVTGVMGSAAAVAVAKLWGFSAALTMGAGLYVVVALLCWWERGRTARDQAGPGRAGGVSGAEDSPDEATG